MLNKQIKNVSRELQQWNISQTFWIGDEYKTNSLKLKILKNNTEKGFLWWKQWEMTFKIEGWGKNIEIRDFSDFFF